MGALLFPPLPTVAQVLPRLIGQLRKIFANLCVKLAAKVLSGPGNVNKFYLHTLGKDKIFYSINL
jgi:hypothetical protein